MRVYPTGMSCCAQELAVLLYTTHTKPERRNLSVNTHSPRMRFPLIAHRQKHSLEHGHSCTLGADHVSKFLRYGFHSGLFSLIDHMQDILQNFFVLFTNSRAPGNPSVKRGPSKVVRKVYEIPKRRDSTDDRILQTDTSTNRFLKKGFGSAK